MKKLLSTISILALLGCSNVQSTTHRPSLGQRCVTDAKFTGHASVPANTKDYSVRVSNRRDWTTGSGTLFLAENKKLYVLTNSHVVNTKDNVLELGEYMDIELDRELWIFGKLIYNTGNEASHDDIAILEIIGLTDEQIGIVAAKYSTPLYASRILDKKPKGASALYNVGYPVVDGLIQRDLVSKGQVVSSCGMWGMSDDVFTEIGYSANLHTRGGSSGSAVWTKDHRLAGIVWGGTRLNKKISFIVSPEDIKKAFKELNII